MNNTMTPQEVFDTVAKHLLAQSDVSVNANAWTCQYRSENGLKCAVGCLITADEYRPDLEGKGLGRMLERAQHINLTSLYNRLSPHVDLLSRLQTIHDQRNVSHWPQLLSSLAVEYNFTQPDELKAALTKEDPIHDPKQGS